MTNHDYAIIVLIASCIAALGLLVAFAITLAMHRSLESRWESFANELQGHWQSFEQTIKSSISILNIKFDGYLLTFEELIDIEKTIDCKEIWIVTGSLEGDIKESALKTIKQNIDRGIKYNYVLPNRTVLRSRAEVLSSRLSTPDKVTFQYIPAGPLIEIINIHDFVIYDPHGTATGRRAYMNVPIRAGKKYFLGLSDEHAETVYSYLKESLQRKRRNATA
jgi:hypothetical protein